jgi:tetratricopeptide (TPR) repeat protein
LSGLQVRRIVLATIQEAKEMQLLCILFALALPMTVYAETNTTTAEATYLMGEGETPALAESKAFDAAKAKAVEQLLPFVAEQTKGSKYPFSPEQVRAIAEATLDVELLEKKRTVVGERFQFSTRLKATVRQEQIASEIARKEKRLVAEKLVGEATKIKSGNSQHAVDLLSQAIETDPTFAEAYFQRYLVYKVWLHQNDIALADISEAVRLAPEDYLEIRAEDYATLGDNKRALADYDEAIRLNPTASLLWNRGELYDKLGQYQKAIADFTKILQLEPGEAMYREFALEGRASAYYSLKQYDRALADSTELIRLTNGGQGFGINGYGIRGLTYMRLGEYEKAALDFTEEINQRSRRASEESPTKSDWSKELFFQRAFAYFLLGEYKEVIPDITEYLRHESVSTKRRADAYILRGKAYGATDNTDKALADYTEAIRADPQRPSAYYRRGGSYVFLRQWDRAASDLTDALRLTMMDTVAPDAKLDENDLATAYTFRGGAYLNLGYGEQAISDLNEALRRKPKDTQALFWRGLAHAERKDRDAARRDLQHACRLGHDTACEAVQSVR